jgi:UDP-N-acetylglucosamine transferase subunit ALG13
MILVLVGTTDFDPLVQAMDELAPRLHEDVIAQIGRGSYVPRNMMCFRFASSLESHYLHADLVVAHGGLGTIVEVLQLGLRLIGVSNPDRYDLHQEDLLRTLAGRGHLIWCRSIGELPGAILEARRRTFRPYRHPRCGIAAHIRTFLEPDARHRD